MGKVPCKIIRTKLLARILSIFHQILHPFLKQIGMLLRKGCLSIHNCNCRCHNQHVGAFLHRHLLLQGINPGFPGVHPIRRIDFPVPGSPLFPSILPCCIGKAVYLPVGIRIPAHIMRCKIVLPYRHFRKMEDRSKHSLYQLGIVEQKQGNGRIADIHRTNAAIGKALLGQEQYLPLRPCNKLVCCNALPISQRYDGGIFLPASFPGGRHQIPVQCITFQYNIVKRTNAVLQCFQYALSIFCPITSQRMAKIHNGSHIIVSHGNQTICLFPAHLSKGQTGCYGRAACSRSCRLHFGIPVMGVKYPAPFLIRNSQISIAPIDGNIIPAVTEDSLPGTAHPGRLESFHMVYPSADSWLFR